MMAAQRPQQAHAAGPQHQQAQDRAQPGARQLLSFTPFITPQMTQAGTVRMHAFADNIYELNELVLKKSLGAIVISFAVPCR